MNNIFRTTGVALVVILAVFSINTTLAIESQSNTQHDEHSHAADAFGLMACDYSERKGEQTKQRDYKFDRSETSSAWAW